MILDRKYELYTSRIDKVFKMTKDETEKNLSMLQTNLKKNPQKYDHDFANLKSYVEDIEE